MRITDKTIFHCFLYIELPQTWVHNWHRFYYWSFMLPTNTHNAPMVLFSSFLPRCFYIVIILFRGTIKMLPFINRIPVLFWKLATQKMHQRLTAMLSFFIHSQFSICHTNISYVEFSSFHLPVVPIWWLFFFLFYFRPGTYPQILFLQFSS